MEDMALTVAEVMKRTRIGRNAVYNAIADGSLKAVRIGRRIVVPTEAVHEWLKRLSNSGAN